MTPVRRIEYEQLSHAEAARVDAACDRFECAWKSVATDGTSPGLPPYCADLLEPARTVLIWELIALDRDYRSRRGESPRPEDYQGLCNDYDEQLPAGAPTEPTGSTRSRGTAESWPAIAGLQIVEVLGAGGMGVVYKAWQPALDRYVAVKMLRDACLNDPEQHERFFREARSVARLQHPNIVQVYELGEIQPIAGSAAQPYFVFEFASGGSLADRLQGNPQSPRAAAQLVKTLARALGHAHERGIVHRDLKPANILLQISDSRLQTEMPAEPTAVKEFQSAICNLYSEIPKITDFGLAKLGRDSDLTRTGDTLGTPSYMAPEQIEGKAATIGPATDVYGLGAILYEILTGRPPFKAETPLATVLQVQRDEPVTLRRLQPTVPRDLETICLKCLQKEPWRRYSTAIALAEDLRRFVAGEPIHARPAGAAEHVGRWCRRKPAVAGLIGALAVAVVGGFIAITALWLVADTNRQSAVNSQNQAELNLGEARKHRAQAEDNFRLARKAVDDFALNVSKDRRLRSSLRPLRKELLETAVQFYEQFVTLRGDDPRVRAELGDAFRRLGEMVREIDDPNRAIAYYQKSRELFAELITGDADNPQYLASLALCDYSLGMLYQETGRNGEWEQSCGRAISLLTRLTVQFPTEDQYALDLARSHAHLGLFYQRAGKYAPAEAEHRSALQILGRLRAKHPSDVRVATNLAGSHNFLGLLYASVKKRTEAAQEYRNALDIQRRLTDENPDEEDHQNHRAATLNNLGLVYYQEHQYADAEREFEAAARINSGLAAKLPEVTQYQHFLAANHSNLGNVCRETRRPDEAVAHYDEANSILRQLIARQPQVPAFASELANNISCVGQVLKSAGKPAEALARFELAIELLEPLRQRGAANAFTMMSLRNAYWRRADTLELLTRYREAIPSWEQAIALEDEASRDKLRLYRARSVALSGDHCSAVTDVEALETKTTSDSEHQFQLARFYAVVTAAVAADPTLAPIKRHDLARRYASQAIACVAAAKAGGLFQNAGHIADLKQDKDFTPLRQIAEFQSLLDSLEMDKRSPDRDYVNEATAPVLPQIGHSDASMANQDHSFIIMLAAPAVPRKQRPGMPAARQAI